MNKKSTYLHWILIAGLSLALCFSVMRTTHRPSDSEMMSSFEIKTDTIWFSSCFEFDSNLKLIEKPRTVFFFITDTLFQEKKISEVLIQRDTLILHLKDSSNISLNQDFLTQYPENPKLLQVDLSQNSFDLSLLSTEGKIYRENYKIDTEFRNYRYSFRNSRNGNLSSENISFWKRFEPFTQVTLKPFNSMMDLDLGVTYKTRKINYEIGISGFYYPQMSNSLGGDLFLRVRYNF